MSVASLILLTALCAPPERPVDFDTEIIPLLTKAGCNGGACHGAAAGRGGFHLALLGGDAAADYDAIVNAFKGRRINLEHPERSLVLGKPTGQLDHGGDVVLDEDGEGAKRLLSWIGEGAQRQARRKLTAFEVRPTMQVVETIGARVPLQAFATFDQHAREDVTQWTVFTTTDSSSLEIDPGTLVAKVRRRGQHVVIARFLDRVVPLQILLPLADQPVNLAEEPRQNFVDDEILKRLTLLRLPVSGPAEDVSWLRRASLDLTGRLPLPAELDAFVSDSSSDKRKQLVDRLLASDAYADYWAHRMAGLLRIQPAPKDAEGSSTFYGWVREQIQRDTPLDEFARALLMGEGDSHVVAPANFARSSPDARAQAELVSQVFLGARLQCANCHNHPLDRWTQDDYHGLAAIFARLSRDRVVKFEARGSVTNPRTGEPAIPRIPGERYLDPDHDGRGDIADWITADNSPHFAKATVNRLWRSLFGRGLVEPADDLRDTNPATHPELLQFLADDFVKHRYSVKHTLRLLALSATYGRSGATNPSNEADDRFYSHSYRRAVEAEVLADAISDVTGISDQYGEEALGTRAIALRNPKTPSETLDILGRCSGGGSCEGVVASSGLPAKLHQLNGDVINRKITAKAGWLHVQIENGRDDKTILNELYRRAVARNPTDAEFAFWLHNLEGATTSERVERLEDIAWGLLNCTEFAMNH